MHICGGRGGSLVTQSRGTWRGAGGSGGQDRFACGNDDFVVRTQGELICQRGTGIQREVKDTNLETLWEKNRQQPSLHKCPASEASLDSELYSPLPSLPPPFLLYILHSAYHLYLLYSPVWSHLSFLYPHGRCVSCGIQCAWALAAG